ncbi:MAG: divalent cation tolerance protein CutA [Alphaproteobacteria bacterium]|nr:divalent cation tolerance protein CutA [Alphaproteobacteria bacterium]
MNFLYVTAPDRQTAEALARGLVEARLAACVNVIGAATSFYRWQGAIQSAEETALIVKTTAEAAPAARDFIMARHPYETPCVVALPIDESLSNGAFLRWIAEATDPATG